MYSSNRTICYQAILPSSPGITAEHCALHSLLACSTRGGELLLHTGGLKVRIAEVNAQGHLEKHGTMPAGGHVHRMQAVCKTTRSQPKVTWVVPSPSEGAACPAHTTPLKTTSI